jgi:type IV secretory pathway VirB3-like protein
MNKIYTSLIKPPLPMGLTQEYIAFLLFVCFIFLPLIFFIGFWIIIFPISIIPPLFIIGRRKIKEDWQYFNILINAIKNNNYDPRTPFTKTLFRK